MAWSPTTDQILNLDGVRRRTDSFRWELCDRDLQPIGELHPDRSDSVPTIQNDTSNATSRRLTGFKLLPTEAADVNVVADRLRVYMRLQNGVEFRLGTFLWADNSRPQRSWGEEQHAELVDLSYILNRKCTRGFGWGRGANIMQIAFFLFFRAGFELEDIAVIGPEANRGLAEPVAWQPGTTWTNMFTDLGGPLGFVAPWLNQDGRIYWDQPPDPAIDAPTVPAYENGTRVIADSIVPNDGLLTAPNDFAAFDSGTARLRSGRYQIPYNAPHSRVNRGFNDGEVENVQGSQTQEQLVKAARNLARKTDVYETLAFDSTLDPRHAPRAWNVVPAFGVNRLETAWSIECRSGGKMHHVTKSVTYDVT